MPFINVNSINNIRSIHNINRDNNNSNSVQASRDLFRFKKLYDTLYKDLTNALSLYAFPNYNALIQTYLNATPETYISTSVSNINNDVNNEISNLVNYKYDPILYNNYSSSVSNIYTGLKAAQTLYTENVALKEQLIRLKEYEDLINKDNNYIINYIKKNLSTIELELPDNIETEKTEINIVIKPWYKEYLLRHGPPINGVFQINLLTSIIQELLNSKIITLDDLNIS